MAEVNALVAHQDAEGSITLRARGRRRRRFLPDGDVQIAVEYSGINYKDAAGHHAEGWRGAGVPTDSRHRRRRNRDAPSSSADFAVGDRVVAHGYDIGTGRHGGYADTARYPADYLVKLDELTTARGRRHRNGGIHRSHERQRDSRGGSHSRQTARFWSPARRAG